MKTKNILSLLFILLLVTLASGCTSSESQDEPVSETLPVVEHEEKAVNLVVHFIDVGHGESILIQINEKNMLIDAGTSQEGNNVVSYLKDNDVKDLDVVVVSNPQTERIGGMVTVMDNFQVNRFIDSGNRHSSRIYENMMFKISENRIPSNSAVAGDTISLDPSVTINVLNPEEPTGHLNDESLVLKLTYGEISFMFTGNAELGAERRIMESGFNVESDILKIGQHGSRSSTGEEFLEKVNPEVCIIMLGEHAYGYPHKDVVDRLDQFGCEVYRTDKNGNIVVTTDGKVYSVKTQL